MGVFEFYLSLIFGLLIFGGVFSVIERLISLLKEEKIDITMDKLNDTLKFMFLTLLCEMASKYRVVS